MTRRSVEELRGLQDQMRQLGGGVSPVVERVVSAVEPPVRTLLGYVELAAAFLPQLRQVLQWTNSAAPHVKEVMAQSAAVVPGKHGRTRLIAAGALVGVGALIYAAGRRSSSRRPKPG